jgi:hypothetical protein
VRRVWIFGVGSSAAREISGNVNWEILFRVIAALAFIGALGAHFRLDDLEKKK